MQPFYYLAYGSNLHPERLRQRTPSATLIGLAHVPGYQLRMHAQGMDHSAKCNIIRRRAHQGVFGALYQIVNDERAALNQFEGPAYTTLTLSAVVANRPYECIAYVAKPEHIDEQLEPYNWYKDLVLLGAYYHQLPDLYTQFIRGMVCKEDVNVRRCQTQVALVKQLKKINNASFGQHTQGRLGLEAIQGYAGRIARVLTKQLLAPEGSLKAKLDAVARYLDQTTIEVIDELVSMQDKATFGPFEAQYTASEFVRKYDALLEHLARMKAVVPCQIHCTLAKWTDQFANFIGLAVGIVFVAGLIFAATIFGYQIYQFPGAFLGFLVLFVISGELMKPVRYVFKRLGLLIANALDRMLRHYAISTSFVMLLVLLFFLYVNRWELPNFLQKFAMVIEQAA